ncbi:hypothetical protein DFH05DRAFT_1512192 [Lentinula detonsa]|uniref:Uncharacterized protein n=1 Tax=Lentinula detonsa TaxID=2804962 RepID=A0A9W8NRT1_9AGAR|nr:hypothetical protein DFH05DRAFT_1512192 [Lentinula detonsa]
MGFYPLTLLMLHQCKVYGATDFVETIKEHTRYSSRTVTFDSTQSPNRGVVMISPVLSGVSKQELQMLVPTAILTQHPPTVICENFSGERTPVADWTDLGVKKYLPDQYIKEVNVRPLFKEISLKCNTPLNPSLGVQNQPK